MARKNFNAAEINRLIETVAKYKHVIENKKSDTENTKKKNEAWEKIAAEFNANNEVERDSKMLKIKYKNFKFTRKNKLAQERQCLYGTGGGPQLSAQMSSLDEKMLDIIATKELAGVANDFDSDALVEYQPNTPTEDSELTKEDEYSFEVIKTPISGPETLRKRKSAQLLTCPRQNKKTSWEKLAAVKSKWCEEKCKEEIKLIKKSQDQIDIQNTLMAEKHAMEMEILATRLQREKKLLDSSV